jgi:hypothetical protein
VGSSTRQSGVTAANKVERLNGEETRAAAGFHAIPSDDVVGPLRDEATGQYISSQLEAMWLQHAEEYRALLDGNCGLSGATLRAFHGSTTASCNESKELLERRAVLVAWLDPTTSKKAHSGLNTLSELRTSRRCWHCKNIRKC